MTDIPHQEELPRQDDLVDVLYDVTGPIAIVTLNRPGRLNAIGGRLTRDLHTALTRAQADPTVRVIVLTGAGRAFCAGDDLKEFDQQTSSPEAVKGHIAGIQQITRDLMLDGKPVVGAVRGFAVGGGFEWLLNCDLVVAGHDLVAFFPEMDWGQFVTGAVTHLLPQAVGYQRAMALFLLGERQSASDLLRMGLVNQIVPAGETLNRALNLAQIIAGKSASSIAALKRLITRQLNPIATTLDLEQEETIHAFNRPEAAERVQRFRRAI